MLLGEAKLLIFERNYNGAIEKLLEGQVSLNAKFKNITVCTCAQSLRKDMHYLLIFFYYRSYRVPTVCG